MSVWLFIHKQCGKIERMDDIIRPKKRSPLGVAKPGTPLGAPVVPKRSPRPTGKVLDLRQKAKHPANAGRPVRRPHEASFVTPEVMADRDIAAAAHAGAQGYDQEYEEPAGTKRRWRPHMPRGKKQWIIASIILTLLLGGGGAAAYWFLVREEAVPKTKPVAKIVEPEPEPTTETSKLSGLEVPIGTNKIPVTAVMIENSPDARPQAGLKDASIVFEAIAEGGITRFCALFQDTAPNYIGPIRSVRPYYLDWLWPFDASVAHVGGAPQALADIKSLGIKDLDQFANSSAYERISSRFAPHNVYSSIEKLRALQASKGHTTAEFNGFSRKQEQKLAVPTAKKINLAISSFFYNAQYDYDAATNTYKRSEGGEIHKDDRSNTQLAPKVVMAVVMPRGIASDGQHTEYSTTGSGKVFIFQDGAVTEGTWSKSGRQAQWGFTDASGNALAFNAGQTWISIVDTPGSVTYTP